MAAEVVIASSEKIEAVVLIMEELVENSEVVEILETEVCDSVDELWLFSNLSVSCLMEAVLVFFTGVVIVEDEVELGPKLRSLGLSVEDDFLDSEN